MTARLTPVDRLLAGVVTAVERLDPSPFLLGGRHGTAGYERARSAPPVVLVSGFANSPHSWRRYAASLAADGFRVYVVDLPGRGLIDMHASVGQLQLALQRIRAHAGQDELSLVGFSQGGLLSRMHAELGAGDQAIEAIVTLATPHNGADGLVGGLGRMLARIPGLRRIVPPSLAQLIAGSEVIAQLQLAQSTRGLARVGRGPRYTSVFAGVSDGLVSARAAQIPNGMNVSLRPSLLNNHYGVLNWSGAAYEAVRGALLAA